MEGPLQGRHSCSWDSLLLLCCFRKKRRAAPATWPPCHAYTPSPATHTPEGLVVPGGTARSWLSGHVWWWRASRAERWSGLGAGWRQGSGIGWEGIEVKLGWLWWRCGALFLPLLSPDWPFSLSHAPPALQPRPPPPTPPPFPPFCGLCTCSPWVWAIKLKDLSTGGWRKSGGSH